MTNTEKESIYSSIQKLKSNVNILNIVNNDFSNPNGSTSKEIVASALSETTENMDMILDDLIKITLP